MYNLENIKENSKIDIVKEEYVIRKSEMMQYLDIIKYLNKSNLGNTCSLCLANNVDVYFQNCGHTACKDCADRIIEYDGGIQNARCSFCRKDIIKINKLYYI